MKRKHTATYHADKGVDSKRKNMSYAELNSKEKQKVLFKSAQRKEEKSIFHPKRKSSVKESIMV